MTSIPDGGKCLQDRAFLLLPIEEELRACGAGRGGLRSVERLVMGESGTRGRENGKPERCGVGTEMRPASSLDSWPPPSFLPSLTLERVQSPTRLPNSESLNVFATSFIVYRKEGKALKLNQGSAGLYIQTPINTALSAVSPRHSPQRSP